MISEKGVCIFCKREGDIYDIRGRKACLKCHIEFLWDYAEGTRRMGDQLNLNECKGDESINKPRPTGIRPTGIFIENKPS